MRRNFVFVALISIFTLAFAARAHAAPPITGTFVSADLGKDQAAYDSMMSELKATGIDKVIVPLGGVQKNCDTGAYTDYSYLTMSNRAEATFIKSALAANMKIFFGIRSPYWSPCIPRSPQGTPNDTNTDMGHLLAHSTRVVNDLRTFLTQNNVGWYDPRIAGLYLTEEINTFYLTDSEIEENIPFFREQSARLKQYGKPILISPWQEDKTDYTLSLQAYKNLISKTDVTIIAPQDSFGTGKTTDFTIGKDHFRALADAKKAYPGKNITIWANIETFTHTPPAGYTPAVPGKPVTSFPADLSRIRQQIEVARPYVSDMITWIYQYSMLSTTESRNAYQTTGWNIMYTPDIFTLRQNLRNQYLAAYSGVPLPSASSNPTLVCSPLYVFNVSSKSCSATSATYTSDQYQCSNGQKTGVTCRQNLNANSGQTTGYCYTSMDLCTKAADATGDGQTTGPDYNAFITSFRAGKNDVDLDKNGKTDIFDYNLIVSYYK